MCNRVGRPPKTHVHMTLANLAVTRCFHSGRKRSILLFMSGVFHFMRTNSRMSTLLKHVPSTMNCRPALTASVNRLRRHVASAGSNSVASVRTMCMPTSSLASPTPTNMFARLSTAAMLDHSVTRLNVCPTMSPLSSADHVLSPGILNRRRCRITHNMRTVLRHCGRLRSVVTVLNVRRLSSSSGIVMTHTEGMREFLSRPFFMTRRFANSPNECMSLGRAVHNFGRVLTNRRSSVPRNTFCVINAVSRTVRGTRGVGGKRWTVTSALAGPVRIRIVDPSKPVCQRANIRVIITHTTSNRFTIVGGRLPLTTTLRVYPIHVVGNKGRRGITMFNNFLRVGSGRMGVMTPLTRLTSAVSVTHTRTTGGHTRSELTSGDGRVSISHTGLTLRHTLAQLGAAKAL